MFNWNDIKNFDVNDVDITKIDFARFDVRNMDLPTFEMPTFEMPNIEMPTFEMPEIPADFDRIVDFARDAAYAGVGAAVVTAQKLDEQRREMADQVTTQVRKLVDSVA